MSAHIDNVPKWVRIAVGVLALVNIAYGIMCYLDVNLLFHYAKAINISNPAIINASHEFAARNLAIGLALGFVTVIKGAPEALTILTIVRALIEIQTIILTIIHGSIDAMLIVPIVFLIAEIFIVKTLVGVIKKEEALENS